jgi:hypothetical protein
MILVLFVLAAACGDNATLSPDAGHNQDSGPADAALPVYKAVALGADYSSGTGIVSRLDLATLSMQTNAVSGVATSDPVMRQFGDKIYIINRSVGENITILDARTLTPIGQHSTGANSNPQDVAVVGDKLYIPAMGTAGVIVMTLPAGTMTTIALDTAVGDPDGKPDCTSAYAVGTKVFVACGLLDASFQPRGVGKVAVIDTTNDSVGPAIALPFKNPLGFFIQSPADSVFAGDLLISTVPDFEVYTTGCVARVSTGATPTATCASGLTNSALGGLVTGAAITPDETLNLAVIVDANFATVSGKLRTYDLHTGMLAPQVPSAMAEQIGDVAACPDGEVVTIDSKMNAEGVRVFEAGSERTTEAKPIGLPPIFSGGVVCYDATNPQ